MKTAKRTICALMCAALTLACLSGCGSAKSATVEADGSANAAQSIENTTAAQESQTAETTTNPTTTAKPTQATTKKPSTTQAATQAQSTAPVLNVDASFFNDAVFIGDSVTLGLKNYVTKQRNKGNSCLGSAKFLASGSLSYSNSMLPLDSKNSVHPKYNGKKVYIDDGVKLTGAKKVFIMLGMNDFCAYPTETGIANAKTLIGKILKKSPDAVIYVESVTPVMADKEHGKFTNANINAFNKALIKMCDENGWTYVDIASIFKDENGCLKKSCCGDSGGMGIHMSFEGCKTWVNFLITNFK